MPNRLRSLTVHRSQTYTQFISKDGDDGSDEDEWDEWFDDFVVAAAKEEPSIPEGPEGGEDEQGQGEESEEEEEEAGKKEGPASIEEGGHPAPSVAGSGSKAAGVRAASIASSYWRPERQDRKGELGGLDDRFEQLATQVSAEPLWRGYTIFSHSHLTPPAVVNCAWVCVMSCLVLPCSDQLPHAPLVLLAVRR